MPFITEEKAWMATAHVAFQQSKEVWLTAREVEEKASQTEIRVWQGVADFIERLEKEARNAQRESQKLAAKKARQEARDEARRARIAAREAKRQIMKAARWETRIAEAKARWHLKFDGGCNGNNCNMSQMP